MAPLINESDCFTLELEVPTTNTMKQAQDTRNSSPTTVCKHDAFLHYSNNETRMNTLMYVYVWTFPCLLFGHYSCYTPCCC